MVYYIVQDWQNTRDNHAGMTHLSKQLHKIDAKNSEVIVVPNIQINGKNNMLLQNILYYMFSMYMSFKIKNASKVFLMEYLLPTHSQYLIAKKIKKQKRVKIIGIAHLVPEDLDRYFPKQQDLLLWAQTVDNIYTFGSSLTSYLLGRGVPATKVTTAFHYVDLDYYKPVDKVYKDGKRLNVIIMGSMKRDVETLFDIVNKTPDVDYIFCAGKNVALKERFSSFSHVETYGFVTEDKLKDLMLRADVSLNVMLDTIGSNVITSSMAVGLPMIVSDVGSIRDYCGSGNTFFCNTTDEFVSAINEIAGDIEKRRAMREASLIIAEEFSIKKFYTQYINEYN
jgi:glycosyltransferase involved in cell wall biosynthesis